MLWLALIKVAEKCYALRYSKCYARVNPPYGEKDMYSIQKLKSPNRSYCQCILWHGHKTFKRFRISYAVFYSKKDRCAFLDKNNVKPRRVFLPSRMGIAQIDCVCKNPCILTVEANVTFLLHA